MKVWIFEDNLMWSSRLVQSLKSLGHEPSIQKEIPSEGSAEVAILNLASKSFAELVPLLRAAGVYTIGHAGHKEKDLLQLGREAGCDAVASNSELTFKIETLLEQAARR
jgi:hypothetical protein